MITAVIIEDEVHNRQTLSLMIKKYCPQITLVGEAGDIETAIKLILKQKPQLIFLDIELPAGTGFDVLEKTKHLPYDIIFVTAYGHYAINAIKFSCLDYLLKPIDIDDLLNAVGKVIEKRKHSGGNASLQLLMEQLHAQPTQIKKILIYHSEGIDILNTADVIRCEAEGNYTWFFLRDNRKIITTRLLGEFEDLLKDSGFFRVHQSHLINLQEVISIQKGEGGCAVMSDKSIVLISRRRKQQFIEVLNKMMKF